MKANVLRNFGLLCLFIVTLLFSSSAFAQKDNCKLETQFDDFTSTTTITGTGVVVGGILNLGKGDSWDIVTRFSAKNSDLFIIVSHVSSGIAVDLSEFSAKFEDGTILKKNVVSRVEESESGIKYTSFPITAADLAKFSLQKIVKIKVVFNTSDRYEHGDDVKDKNAEKVRQNALCILKQTSTPTAKL